MLQFILSILTHRIKRRELCVLSLFLPLVVRWRERESQCQGFGFVSQLTSKRFAKLVNDYEKTIIMLTTQSHSFNTKLESTTTTHKFLPQWLGWLRQRGMSFPGGDGQLQWQPTNDRSDVLIDKTGRQAAWSNDSNTKGKC